jgi:hypothetical protein
MIVHHMIEKLRLHKNSVLSILIGFAGLLLLIRNNYNLSVLYLSAKGKARGLFGLVEVFNCYFKYYILVIVAVSLVFAFWAIRKKEEQAFVYIAIGICVFTSIMVFVPLWRLMV